MSQGSVKNSRIIGELGLSLVFLAVSIFVLLAMPHIKVSAHNGTQGGWDEGKTVRWYYYGANHTYLSQLALADDDWNAGQNFITFLHTTDSSLRNIAVKDTHGGDNYYGMVVGFDCWCTYLGAQGELDMNVDNLLSSKSSGFKQRVGAHEFGHTLGLRHMLKYNPPDPDYYAVPSIMKEYVDDVSYNWPKPHDFDDLAAGYGGW